MSLQLVFIQEVHNNCRQTQETGCAVMAQSYFNWPSPSSTSLNCVKLSSSTLMDYWTAQERQQTFHFPSSLTKAPIPVCNSSGPYCCSSSCFFLLLFLHAVLSFSLDPVVIVLFSLDVHRYVSETYVQHVCSIKKGFFYRFGVFGVPFKTNTCAWPIKCVMILIAWIEVS